MKPLLKALGYRSSKNDRLVLKWFLIICCLIASTIGLLALRAILPALWNPQAKRDGIRLDSILSTQHFDRVEFMSANRTNLIVGVEAEDFVVSLHRTNRIPNIDWTKQQVEHVRLLSGTNQVWLTQGEDGAWEFGEYGFRLRR